MTIEVLSGLDILLAIPRYLSRRAGGRPVALLDASGTGTHLHVHSEYSILDGGFEPSTSSPRESSTANPSKYGELHEIAKRLQREP